MALSKIEQLSLLIRRLPRQNENGMSRQASMGGKIYGPIHQYINDLRKIRETGPGSSSPKPQEYRGPVHDVTPRELITPLPMPIPWWQYWNWPRITRK